MSSKTTEYSTDIFNFQVENVQLLDNLNTKNSSLGTLYITTTHLIFVSPEVSGNSSIMWLLQFELMRPKLHFENC